MQTFSGSCSPERLHTLQKIFDAIWSDVQAGSHRATEALRNEIARRVIRHLNDVDPQPDEIVHAILNSLNIDSDHLSPRVTQVEALSGPPGSTASIGHGRFSQNTPRAA